MATRSPASPLLDDDRSIWWYGVLAERVGAAVASVALAVAAVTAVPLASDAATASAAVAQVAHVAAADPGSLSLVAATCHYALMGVAVGTWFLGLGFILTGVFERDDAL
ncbi:hypothetical protein [Haloarchaeobius sp. HRN-SO-5]|uniref:hypothetical protein n=1 Tax=Haloarchaeobius sp. HRN-SO-5 TaxID=3446118 RepID=UPI003EBD2D99